MIKAKPPKKSHLTWNEICSSALITIIHLMAVILMLTSGTFIIWQYASIILGYKPTEIIKMGLDYSITVFAGSALYLLLYMYKVEELVKRIFNVKSVKPVK